jgi:hypothetical protein
MASLKCQLIFHILHGIISQQTELLIAELDIVSAFLNIFAIAHVPLTTRWGACTEAVNIYSENFENVKSIVAKFPSESAVLVRESQRPKSGLFNCLHLKQFRLTSGEHKMLWNPGTSSARIYGHNEKCK